MIPSWKVRIKKTPNCRHLYMATVTREAAYGWGNSPTEARDKFYEVRYRLFLESVERNVRP
jgi:hypothetical protein